MGEVGTNGEYHNGSRPPEARDGPSPCGTPEQWYGDIVFADARSNPCDCGGVQGTGTNVQSGQGEYLGPPAIVMGYGSQPQSGSSPWVGEGNNVQSGQGSLDPYDQVGAGHQPQSGEGEPVLTDLYVGGPPGPHSSGHHSPGTANLNVGFDRGFDVFDGGPSDNVPDLTVGDVLPDPTPGTDCSDALVCEVGHTYGPFAVRGLDQYWFTIDSPSGGSTFTLEYDDPPEGGQVMTVYTGTCSTLTFESNVTDNPGDLPEGPRILRLQIFAVDPSLYRNVTIHFS